ncbi:MAG: Crp/Fnr family transcriptional regulator [Gammaproteobacteria bacterium]|nr:Crp/Fnr family transcriptional regulator [Gammaproteobacteria bacterium]
MNDSQNLLKNIPIFTDLDDEALALVLSKARSLTFRKNAVLMSEGETGECLYVIQSGSVKVFVSDEEGNELILFIEGPGSYLGEISLLDDQPRTASAVTLEKTQVLVIAKSAFMECIELNPEIAFRIIRAMTQRLRRSTDNIRGLALKNVYQRLALKLIELSVEENERRYLPRKYSHQELASMIGASREMVGKILAELTKGEYVQVQENRLHLKKALPHDW